MIDYGTVYSTNKPESIEVSATSVFIATNITPHEEVLEGHIFVGYKYDLIQYTKDEYIKILEQNNEKLESDLLDTQDALCEIYELLEGGML